jgi:hypothetical protein
MNDSIKVIDLGNAAEETMANGDKGELDPAPVEGTRTHF